MDVFGIFMLFSRNLFNVLHSRKLFSPEELSRVNPKGNFQVWVGSKSPLIDAEFAQSTFFRADALRHEQNPQAPRLKFYKVEGAEFYGRMDVKRY